MPRRGRIPTKNFWMDANGNPTDHIPFVTLSTGERVDPAEFFNRYNYDQWEKLKYPDHYNGGSAVHPDYHLWALYGKHSDVYIRRYAMRHPLTTDEMALELFQHPDPVVRAEVLHSGREMPEAIISQSLRDPDEQIRGAAIAHPSFDPQVHFPILMDLPTNVKDEEGLDRNLRLQALHSYMRGAGDIPEQYIGALLDLNDPTLTQRIASGSYNLLPEHYERLINDPSDIVRSKIAHRIDTPPEILAKLLQDKTAEIRATALRNEKLPHDLRDSLAHDRKQEVREVVASMTQNPDILKGYVNDRAKAVRDAAMQNSKMPLEGFTLAASHPDVSMRERALNRPDLPTEAVAKLMDDPDPAIKSRAFLHPKADPVRVNNAVLELISKAKENDNWYSNPAHRQLDRSLQAEAITPETLTKIMDELPNNSRFIKKALAHPNSTDEMLMRGLKMASPTDGYQANIPQIILSDMTDRLKPEHIDYILGNREKFDTYSLMDLADAPGFDENHAKRVLAESPQWEAFFNANGDGYYWKKMKDKIATATAFIQPDANHKEKVGVSFGTNKARIVRDLIESAGKTSVRPNDPILGQKYRNLPPQWRDRRGDISIESIQKWIDSQPKVVYNVSHGLWEKGGGQQHNDMPSKVFQVNFTDDQIRRLKEAGVFQTFKRMHKKFYNSHHPATPSTLGWVRYTGNPKKGNGIFIDETQSDIGQNAMRALRDESRKGDFPEDHLKTIENILWNGKKTSEVLAESFLHYLRGKGFHDADVAIHSVDTKKYISLGNPDGQIPGHFLFSYKEMPEKVLGWEPKTYGYMPTMNGWQDEHRQYDHLTQQSPVWGGKIRKFEEPLFKTEPSQDQIDEWHKIIDDAIRTMETDPDYIDWNSVRRAETELIRMDRLTDDEFRYLKESPDDGVKGRLYGSSKVSREEALGTGITSEPRDETWTMGRKVQYRFAMENPNVTKEDLLKCAKMPGNEYYLADGAGNWLIRNKNVDGDVLEALWNLRSSYDLDSDLREKIATHPALPESLVEDWKQGGDDWEKSAALQSYVRSNPKITEGEMEEFLNLGTDIAHEVLKNPKFPKSRIDAILRDPSKNIAWAGIISGRNDLETSDLLRIANEVQNNEEVRGNNPDLPSQLLKHPKFNGPEAATLALNWMNDSASYGKRTRKMFVNQFLQTNGHDPAVVEQVYHTITDPDMKMNLLTERGTPTMINDAVNSGNPTLVDAALSNTNADPTHLERVWQRYSNPQGNDIGNRALLMRVARHQQATIDQRIRALEHYDPSIRGAAFSNADYTRASHPTELVDKLMDLATTLPKESGYLDVLKANLTQLGSVTRHMDKLINMDSTPILDHLITDHIEEMSPEQIQTLGNNILERAKRTLPVNGVPVKNEDYENNRICRRFFALVDATHVSDDLFQKALDSNTGAIAGLSENSTISADRSDKVLQKTYDLERTSPEPEEEPLDSHLAWAQQFMQPAGDMRSNMLNNSSVTENGITKLLNDPMEQNRRDAILDRHFNPQVHLPIVMGRNDPAMLDVLARSTHLGEFTDEQLTHIHDVLSRAVNTMNGEPLYPQGLNSVKKKIAENNPDAAHTESTMVKINTNKLRKIRDAILGTGKMDAKPKMLGQLAQGLNPKYRLPNGNISAEKIQGDIDAMAGTKYNISHTVWNRGLQTHNNKPQKVFQLNINSDMMQKMKEAGVYHVFRKLVDRSAAGGHPSSPTTLGWIRYTGTPEEGIHIDEIQSDLQKDPERKALDYARRVNGGRPLTEDQIKKTVENVRKEYPEGHWAKMMEIAFGNQADHPHEIIFDGFLQMLRDQGHHDTTLHINSKDMKHKIYKLSNLSPETPIPAHFITTYEKLPKKYGWEPSVYGLLPTQDANDIKANPIKNTYAGKVRKFEE